MTWQFVITHTIHQNEIPLDYTHTEIVYQHVVPPQMNSFYFYYNQQMHN